jgi:hypothetical protein
MHKSHKNRHFALFPGLILITLGAGLLAREFGLLPSTVRAVDFWPILVVGFGSSSLLRRRGFWGVLFSLAVIGLGGVLLAGNLGFLAFPAARLWPALLLLVGIAFLIRGATAARRGPPPDSPLGSGGRPDEGSNPGSGPHRPFHGHHYELTSEADRLSRQFTAAGAQLRIESQAWKGGELGVTAGGVELDLRNARLAPEGALLDVRVLMGGIELRVPDTWQVQCDVTPLFGGADDMTRSTQGATDAPRLRIVGSVTLGGLTIQN